MFYQKSLPFQAGDLRGAGGGPGGEAQGRS